MCGVGAEMLLYDEAECCVSCDKETPYSKFDDINNRLYYVEGAGQLCRNCWHEIYDD